MLDAGNIAIRPMNPSFKGIDLGYIDGEIEVAIDAEFKEILAHQTGNTPISKSLIGVVVTITMSLKETHAANMKMALSTVGGTYTPTGGGTEMYGIGTSKNNANVIEQAGRLVLHPVGVSDSDKSKDWTIWKAYPRLESLTFSGTDEALIPVTFDCFVDTTKPAAISVLAIGDSTQEEFDETP